MISYDFFLHLALILLATKVLGMLSRKLHMPQVVGALIAGLILGPNILGLVEETTFLSMMAELGVIFIMFMAGMETDIKQLKQTGKASFIIAIFGVVIPLGGGFLIASAFHGGFAFTDTKQVLENIFIGIILMATSVTISVETLREMGKLSTKTGTAILGAAVIDDIVGIIALTVLMSLGDASIHVGVVILKILGFFVFAGVTGAGFYFLFKYLSKKHGRKRRVPVYSLVFCLLLSYSAEHFFGVADITGAYLAGAMISNITLSGYVNSKVEVTSYMLFSPVFFASIGLRAKIDNFTPDVIWFTVALIAVALLSKIIGGGVGARLSGFSFPQSLRTGIGMMARGEVALIVADRGVSAGLIPHEHLTPIVILVIVSSILTPILLKASYNSRGSDIQMLQQTRYSAYRDRHFNSSFTD
ncbi:MAG: cation:proton antiporter [Eubacteriales bacterium]